MMYQILMMAFIHLNKVGLNCQLGIEEQKTHDLISAGGSIHADRYREQNSWCQIEKSQVDFGVFFKSAMLLRRTELGCGRQDRESEMPYRRTSRPQRS